MKILAGAAIAALLSAGATPAAAVVVGNARDGLDAMRALNLIVLENYSAAADVEGKTYVGGNLTGSATLGLGNAANGQFASDLGFHSTLAVGGSNNGQINLNHGTGAGDNYGAVIGGNSGQLSVNAAGGTVRVGGNLTSNINLQNNTSLFVTGSVNGISAGQNSHVAVGGNATSGNYNFGTGSSIEIVGSLANIGLGANSINKVGGSVTNVNGANGAKLYVGGSIGGNANANGAQFLSNHEFNAGVAAPAAPAAVSLTVTTAQLKADVLALSSALGGLTIVSNPSTITYGSQGPTFHAADSGAGYALFNVDQSIFNFGEVSYDFANATLPVIINVINSDPALHAAMSATYNWNLNPVGGANASHNQQVIWNFTDASTLNLNRAVYGSILAPNAVVANNGPLNGSVIARVLNQGGEIHLGTYNRGDQFFSDDAAAVPEPAVWVQLIAGFGLAGAMLRRRRTSLAAG